MPNGERRRALFDPRAAVPYRLSRSKIELFLECPRCFYLDRRLGIERPPSFPYTLNSAVDALLKKEFDGYRRRRMPHPLMVEHGIDALPFEDPRLEEWRDTTKGIRYHHKLTNLVLMGAVDDVWANSEGKLMIVDYKSTSKDGEIGLDSPWQGAYKRQMEFYQWLFRRNGFRVSDTGYFVYCNACRDKAGFEARLEFTIKVIAYTGSDAWVDQAVVDAFTCLRGLTPPEAASGCAHCRYFARLKECEGRPAPG